jgi:tetratricopeptide (TPR) repeat protein
MTTERAQRRYTRAALAGLAILVCCTVSGGCGVAAIGQNAGGVQLYQQGYYVGALERFQKAVASDPRNADSYYNLAATYHQLAKTSRRQDELDQAESLYNQCLDRAPDHRDCYRGLAVLLVEQGRSAEAHRLLEGWASRSPTLAGPRIEIARLLEEQGDRTAAKDRLIEALAIDPYDARALAALGRLHEQLGNPTQALADYERSMWQDRFQPEVAARVAALRSTLSPSTVATAPAGTRTVQSLPSAPRY